MFDMMKPLATWDDMWQNMIALTEYPLNGKTLKDIGLRKLITRPHNIVNVTDPKTNQVIEQRLEVVTTPFKKDEVKVEISGKNLIVRCGTDPALGDPCEEPQAPDAPKENYLYKGISEQYYTFQLKLSDKVDVANIKAKNQDGILTVTLPYKKEELYQVVTPIEVE